MRFLAKFILVLFLTNNIAPTLQFAFADSTQYYVSATGGSDANDGLSPATAWQTIAQVNGTSLLQGDTVSFLCTDTWNETLTLSAVNGGVGLPITINSYGVSCGTDKASIDVINITNSTRITVSDINLTTPTLGSSMSINGSNMINVMNTNLTNGSGICMSISNSSGTIVDGNNFSSCQYAVNVNEAELTIDNNTVSTISEDAISVTSSLPVVISNNTLSNIAQSAIIYGQDTDVMQNSITNSCSTGSEDCAAIKNDATLSGATVTSLINSNTISGVGSGISGSGSYGIFTSNIAGASITNNGIINAENAIRVIDANNLNISNNTLVNSRARTVWVSQENPGLTHTNIFNSNSILQKNPDYPHIEMRDEVPLSNLANSFLTANANSFYPNYKPNTSYVRSINFGGMTIEYTKNTLEQFDAGITKFEYFAYKPYTNTGSYATLNLLSNPDFSVDTSNWTAAAETGLAPTLSHNMVGTDIGGSMNVSPTDTTPDRMWVSNDASLSITAGQTYLVTGYAKSSTGTINLRGFLHESGNMANIYSDRIAETHVTSTGGRFTFYITTKTTASDAILSLETSNQDVSYELDTISIRRMNAVVKNTNVNEIHVFSNTGASLYNQPCPGGAPCFAYVDGINSTISWPTPIPAYTTKFVLWNGSPNIINTPACTLNLSAGSVPTGQPVDVMWTTADSDNQVLTYETYTGVVTGAVSSTGMISFIPPYDAVTTISIDTINDVGPNQCSVQVTTTNTSPYINPGTTTGSEDASQIDGTLSGVDLNPGDSIFFEQFGTNVSQGFVNVESSGSFQYYPNADYCGNDTFEFRAYDQLGHYADPVTQTLQIECTNDTPVAISDTGSAYAGSPVLLNVLANDTDVDTPYEVQTFTINNVSAVTNGIANIVSNQIQYTPNIGFSGTEIFSYRLVDQSGALSNTGTVTVGVTIFNTPPTAIGASYNVNEDTTLADTLTGSDSEGNPLTFTASLLPTNGTLNLLSNGTFTYIPDSQFFGADSFEFIVNDGMANSSGATVSLTIDPIGDAPIATPDSYSLDQDTTLFIPVMMNDSDIDSTVLTLTGYTNPSNGTLVISGTGFDYTPTTGYIGADSFTYQIVDDTGLTSNTTTVMLNVISTNMAPTANPDSFMTNEDIILSGNVTATDPENSTLTYIVDTLPTQGSLSLSSTGSFIYSPNPDFFGSDSFVFHVSDGVLVSSGAMIDITINSVNDAPIANASSFTATGNSMASSGNLYIGNLSGSDIETVGLSFTTSTLPIHGQLTLSSTGVMTYLPALGYTGSDSFTFTVSDGNALSIASTVNITVIDNGVIPPPQTPSPVITLSASPLSIAYNGTSTITWSSTDATSCTKSWGIASTGGTYTTPTLTSTTSYAISCTGSGGTTTSNITISVGGAPVPINGICGSAHGTTMPTPGPTANLCTQGTPTAVSGTGPWTWSCMGTNGGTSSPTCNTSLSSLPPSSSNPTTGGGGGQSNPVSYSVVTVSAIGQTPVKIGNNEVETIELNSASNQEPQTTFVMQDPSGLLGQLFLTNRYLGTPMINTPVGTISSTMTGAMSDSVAGTIIDSLDSSLLDDTDGPLILRQIAQLFIVEARESEDPISLYEYGITKIRALDIDPDSRLALTQTYIIRIFEQQKKRYEENVYRNILGRFEDTLNSASEDIEDIEL